MLNKTMTPRNNVKMGSFTNPNNLIYTPHRISNCPQILTGPERDSMLGKRYSYC